MRNIKQLSLLNLRIILFYTTLIFLYLAKIHPPILQSSAFKIITKSVVQMELILFYQTQNNFLSSLNTHTLFGNPIALLLFFKFFKSMYVHKELQEKIFLLLERILPDSNQQLFGWNYVKSLVPNLGIKSKLSPKQPYQKMILI